MSEIEKSLSFSPLVCVAQIVLFIVLLAIMNAVFWKPVLAHLKSRDREITDAYDHRDKLQRDMEQLRADYVARLAQVEAEARSHIQAAVKEAQAERERLLAEARSSSDAALKSGIAGLESETREALQSLRGNMVGIAVEAASRALGNAVETSAIRATVEAGMKAE